MKKLLFIVSLLGLMAALANVAAAQPGHRIKDDNREIPDPKWLHEEVERARAKHKIPALAACLVIGDKVVAASATGHRKVGDPKQVTQNDRFCICSCTKPMTSTLVGALVEKGVLTFDTTMEKMFPELVQKMQPGYRKVTVRMLLSHTSGMPGDPKKAEPHQLTPDEPDKTMAHRYQYVCNAIVDPPAAQPGTRNIYCSSNVIVVSYLERKLKKPYEELMDEYVFRPLGMDTAGNFMMVSGPDDLDSPWPHKLVDGRYVPEPLHIGRGFSRAPGGGACLSIGDFGKWAAAHLEGRMAVPTCCEALPSANCTGCCSPILPCRSVVSRPAGPTTPMSSGTMAPTSASLPLSTLCRRRTMRFALPPTATARIPARLRRT